MGGHLLDLHVTKRHIYSLHWRREVVLFQVDGREVHRVADPPTLPLGFMAWMDNNCASMTPAGGLETGLWAGPPDNGWRSTILVSLLAEGEEGRG